MNGPDAQGPAITLSLNPRTGLIDIHDPPPAATHTWTLADLHAHTRSTLLAAATRCQAGHPDRFIYALVGRAFVATAPRPIGGKREPGFREFDGVTADDALNWLLRIAVAPPLTGRGRKRQPAGEILRWLVEEFNKVLGLGMRVAPGVGDLAAKDEMDNWVLTGMAQAGHLPNTNRIVLPEYLRVPFDAKPSRTPSPTKLSSNDTINLQAPEQVLKSQAPAPAAT
ncbi:hypothetical protein HDU96_006350 [Phlyctochytrium bullatum]|nr:hypothetical protein HDU96_006350 [Phlyctochytrium bullatum]